MAEVERTPAVERRPSSSGRPLLVAEQVTKIYRTGNVDVLALYRVSLTVSAGEFVAIVGPPNSGKSTLLACLSGVETVDAGQVIVEGAEITPGTVARGGGPPTEPVSFVTRSCELVPTLTAVENVRLNVRPVTGAADRATSTALEMLDQVGVAARANRRPRELSRGERQRVAVARALASRPAILWADEPTGDLDPGAAGRFMEVLRRISSEHGQAIVLSTRELAVGLAADRLIHIHRGRLKPETVWINGHVGLPGSTQPWWSPPVMG
ncbi:MAG: ABC transporter ATP-binding protein [Actinomycetes bacterium]